MTEILAAAQRAVKLALSRGFTEAEAFSSKIIRREIIYRNKVEATKTGTIVGLGIRGVLGKRIGFYSVSSLDSRDIDAAVESCLNIAKASSEDSDWRSLPTKYGKASVEKVYDRKIPQLSARDIVEQVRIAIDTVSEVNKAVSVTRGYISASVSHDAISNSHDCNLERKETNVSSWISVKVGEAEGKGAAREYSESRDWKGLNMEDMAGSVAERAVKMTKAKPLPNGKVPVVWRNDTFASIVDAMLTRTITADAVQRNRSPWAGKVGQPIASEDVTIIDDGRRPGGLGTRAFDDDGALQRRTPIIEKGVLRGFLYDTYTANKENRPSTGNAHRDVGLFASAPNYSRSPSPYPNNLIVSPGDADPEEVSKETGNGLFVVETIGEWLSNPISGELSATVSSGFLIEGGELGRAVKGVIVTSNFFEILKGKMDLRAQDLRPAGPVYAPTTRVLDMTVAGE